MQVNTAVFHLPDSTRTIKCIHSLLLNILYPSLLWNNDGVKLT